MSQSENSQIENPEKLDLPKWIYELLQQKFANSVKVRIEKEFGSGLSDSRVLLVRPYRADGAAELPAIIKLAPAALIEQEGEAVQQHISGVLSGFMEIQTEPLYLNEYGLLRYRTAGDGIFESVSLKQYCQRAQLNDIQYILQERLYLQMGEIWKNNDRLERTVQSCYDRVLPVNLLIKPLSAKLLKLVDISKLPVLDANNLMTSQAELAALESDDPIMLKNFIVIERDEHQITLNDADGIYRIRYQLSKNETSYAVGQRITDIAGEIVATRSQLLTQYIHGHLINESGLAAPELTLPGEIDVQLPNPFLKLSEILATTHKFKISAIHGDLNLENILVDPDARTVQIIDGANARQDHVLHDLNHLEVEVLTHLLAGTIWQAKLAPTAIYQLYHSLHCATIADPHPDEQLAYPAELDPALKKIFVILLSVRREAQKYLIDPDNWQPYYDGLFCYLLGALKFKNLDRAPVGQRPKEIAFWGAATVAQLRQGKADCNQFTWQLLQLDDDDEPKEPPAHNTRNVHIDNRSGGNYFSDRVTIQGDVINGSTVHKTTYGTNQVGVDESDEDFLAQQLADHTRNLRRLQRQQTIYGAGEEPLRLLNQIEAEEQKIAKIHQSLHENTSELESFQDSVTARNVSQNVQTTGLGHSLNTVQEKMNLVTALLQCPSIRERHTRDDIVDHLPSDIHRRISRSNVDNVDVMNIVKRVLDYPDGLTNLLEIVRFYESDSTPMKEVNKLVGREEN